MLGDIGTAAFTDSKTFADIVAGAVGPAMSGTRFRFASNGNFFGHGYSELANCIYDYTSANRATIISTAYDTALTAQKAALDGASWDNTGTAAARTAALTALGSSGSAGLLSTAGQGSVLQAYVLSADEPWDTLTASFSGNAGLTSARQAAFGIVATGGDLTAPSSAATIDAILSVSLILV